MLKQAGATGQGVPLAARPGSGTLAGVSPGSPAPRLPVRASIYVAPDGTVHFGALFAELQPVAAALAAPTATVTAIATATATATVTATVTPT